MPFAQRAVGVADLRARVEHLLAKAVAGLEHQQVDLAQVARPDFAPLGPGVGARHDHPEGLVVQGPHADAGLVEGQRHDHRIDLAVLERVDEQAGHALLDEEAGVRRQAAHRADQLGQQVRRDGVDHPEAEFAAQVIAPAFGHRFDPPRFLEHPPRLGDHPLAHRRQRGVPLAALDQAHPQLVLEVLHRHAQGRLADMATLGGAAECAFVSEGHEVAQHRQLHRRHSLSLCAV